MTLFVLNDLSFLGGFEFFKNGFIGGDFKFLFSLMKDEPLLTVSDERGEEVVKNQGAREREHDKEEHDRHKVRHLGGRHVVDFCLVEFLPFSGFFHELTERLGLRLSGGALLFRG